MQATAEADGDVTMATVTPTEVKVTKPQPAMSARASAFTIASLMADSERSSVSRTSSTTTDSDCISSTGTCHESRKRRDIESRTASPELRSNCTSVGTYTVGRDSSTTLCFMKVPTFKLFCNLVKS